MEMSGQIRAPPALPSEKTSHITVGGWAGPKTDPDTEEK
jgi:hypothetical protein